MEYDDVDWIIEPIITYKIGNHWFKESELYENKKDLNYNK